MLNIIPKKIAGCLLLLFSLQIMAADKEVEEALLAMSKDLNKNFPLQVDKEKIIETSAAVGDTLVFKYKFISDTTISDPRFNPKLYEKHLLTSLQGSTCSDPNIKALMQRGGKFNYLFVDRVGNKIIDFTLNSEKCGENVFIAGSGQQPESNAIEAKKPMQNLQKSQEVPTAQPKENWHNENDQIIADSYESNFPSKISDNKFDKSLSNAKNPLNQKPQFSSEDEVYVWADSQLSTSIQGEDLILAHKYAKIWQYRIAHDADRASLEALYIGYSVIIHNLTNGICRPKPGEANVATKLENGNIRFGAMECKIIEPERLVK